MKKRLKIAILSRNPNLYSTQRLKMAGELQGHEMHVIDHTKCDIIIEQKKPQIFLLRSLRSRRGVGLGVSLGRSALRVLLKVLDLLDGQSLS